MGHTWNTRAERIKKESNLIELDRSLCYNKYTSFGRSGEENGFFNKNHSPKTKEAIGGPQRGVPKDLLGKKIILDGISYPSIAEASRNTNHARKTIRAWLNDPTNLRCTQDD
uniref:Putative GIY YIG homing endonuclease n=1 Tax=Stephanosphaera pluvialis TaxID=51712 RepID=A0A0S2IDA7_9CHLO|nr:putative GIY YIG homing endonuclease [Stephanosphaera pluvialis]